MVRFLFLSQEGRYEYKYIVDGEWTYNEFELVTTPNKDGHVNNFLHVSFYFLVWLSSEERAQSYSLKEEWYWWWVQVVNSDPNSGNGEVRKRLTSDDPDLTKEERIQIRRFLESYSDWRLE